MRIQKVGVTILSNWLRMYCLILSIIFSGNRGLQFPQANYDTLSHHQAIGTETSKHDKLTIVTKGLRMIMELKLLD